MNQIATYWELGYFTDIKVYDGFVECDSDYEKLIVRSWKGTRIGCDCRGIYSEWIPPESVNALVVGTCTTN